MTATRRVYFLNHDYRNPSGGIRVLYRYAELLQKNGFDAFIVHREKRFRLSWFQSDAAVVSLSEIKPTAQDILVVPENYRSADAMFPVPQKILFCQSFFYAFRGFASTVRWRTWCNELASVSEMITEFIRTALHIDRVAYWPVYIDRTTFQPREKKLQICYMPRKRPDEAKFIRQAFTSMYPQFAAIPWVRIDRVSEAETARIMGESAVFLALGRHEGLGLPPLEAMASGCAVAGFHGGGGREFATDGNGIWVPDGDLFACVHALAEAVARCDDPSLHADHDATLRRYSVEYVEETLRNYWTARLQEPIN